MRPTDPPGSAALHRVARMVVATLVVNVAAFLTVRIVWPGAVLPMLVGWCMSWLTAVIWLNFQEARGVR